MKTHRMSKKALARAEVKGRSKAWAKSCGWRPLSSHSDDPTCEHCRSAWGMRAGRRSPEEPQPEPARSGGAVYLDPWTPAQPWIDWALRGE